MGSIVAFPAPTPKPAPGTTPGDHNAALAAVYAARAWSLEAVPSEDGAWLGLAPVEEEGEEAHPFAFAVMRDGSGILLHRLEDDRVWRFDGAGEAVLAAVRGQLVGAA